MKKYLNLLQYEIKTLLKDSMSMFVMFYPFLMLLIAGYIVPAAVKEGNNPQAAAVTLMIVLAVAISIGSFVAGAMLAFSLIESKDEKTILSISVTPIETKGYVWFKVSYTYIVSLIGNFIILGGLKLFASEAYTITYGEATIPLLNNLTWPHIIAFVFVTSLLVPTVALLIASLAKNKIEGFAIVKSSGIVIMLPMLTLLTFFQDWKQYLLGVLPNFWPIKAMLNLALGDMGTHNLPFIGYLVIGSVYFVVLSLASLKMFMKKANLN